MNVYKPELGFPSIKGRKIPAYQQAGVVKASSTTDLVNNGFGVLDDLLVFSIN